jgi:hypothetical protein
MTHVHVSLDIEKANFPLRPIYVGQGSALKVHLTGAGVSDTAAAKLVLTPVGGGSAAAYASARNADGDLEIYVSGWSFPTAGATTYEINVYETEGDPEETRAYWMGKGALHVFAANTVAEVPDAPFVPEDTYIYNPVTELYYRVIADQDPVTGLIALSISQEGVPSVP